MLAIVLSLLILVGMIPGAALAADGEPTDVPFTLTVNGEVMTDITYTANAYRYNISGMEEKTADQYKVVVPAGTTEVSVNFDKNVLCYGYYLNNDGVAVELDPDTAYPNDKYGVGETSCVRDITAASNGWKLALQIQNPWPPGGNGNVLYGIVFEYSESQDNEPEKVDGVYQIGTAAELAWFRDKVNGGDNNINAALTADIDLSAYENWVAIGVSSSVPYRGNFDGNNYEITGLTVNCAAESYSNYGLFGKVGYILDGITEIKNLKVSGTITLTGASGVDYFYVGGLAGSATFSDITNVTADVDISASGEMSGSHFGGIVGFATDIKFSNCVNYGDIRGNASVAGIVSWASKDLSGFGSVIDRCANYGEIYAADTGIINYAGGIVANAGKVTITNCYNAGKIGSNDTSAYAGGIAGAGCNYTSGDTEKQTVVKNCFNVGEIDRSAYGAQIIGHFNQTDSKYDQAVVENVYYNTNVYYNGTQTTVKGMYALNENYKDSAVAKTAEEMASQEFVDLLNKNAGETVFAKGDTYPVFAADEPEHEHSVECWVDKYTSLGGGMHKYEKFCSVTGEAIIVDGSPVTHDEKCADSDSDGLCDKCGYDLTVPSLVAGVEPTKSAQVIVGKAYLLTDLQAGRIFTAADGSKLGTDCYYYQRSEDGGDTWSAMQKFSDALFGGTTLQITEPKEGTYMYKFYASDDEGETFSTDTWTLTLDVREQIDLDVTFYVGQDQNYKTNGNKYPIIKVYPTTGVDSETGYDTYNEEDAITFTYSNFTDALPEGTDEYDPNLGKVENNYNMFYAKLSSGQYSYRAYGWNPETEQYDIELGGMALNLPLDSNVDGAASGGTNVYLRLQSVYTSSKFNDGFLTASDYTAKVICPIMGCNATPGTAYTSGNYAYYPFMLYAGGNSCLYNFYVNATGDMAEIASSGFSINRTVPTGYTALSQNVTMSARKVVTVEVPAGAEFGLYHQWNNFNTERWKPASEETTSNGGTKYTFDVFVGSNWTWRLTDTTGEYVTQAGWGFPEEDPDGIARMSFAEGDPTDELTHDFSGLGSQVIKRDEADLMVNLDPSGWESVTDTTRVRAYRHWEIIDNDAGNIMLEPDFHWEKLSGDATLTPVDGGNSTENWADISNVDGIAIYGVYYDSINASPDNAGTHGGVFPATNPERVGVIVVTDGSNDGTADADVDFNMAVGATTTRSMDWDYNYDTWFYSASNDSPALDFAVNATGDVSVEYAFVAADDSMNMTLSEFKSVTAAEDGRYYIGLEAFRTLGNGKGGTVIIKMTDDTGVSYRLVRVAEVVITATNASNPGEPFMPGDEVTLTFDGMYRAVNKIAGVFNPTNFTLRYSAGDTEVSGTLGQYQQMDNASITLTIPEDLEIPAGGKTTYAFTNGYVYGSMYSAANPFAFMYNMTDAGTGTNFNAVMVSFYISSFADAEIEVVEKVVYDTVLNVTDGENAVDGYTVTIEDPDGEAVEAEEGVYKLGYGTYSYSISKAGYVCTTGTFSLGSATQVGQDGRVTIDIVLPLAAENAWDGTSMTEPSQENGVYQIGTGAELAWFTNAVNSGNADIDAVLTADIDLAGYNWTPIGTSTNKFAGDFDGNGHRVYNFAIEFTSTGIPYLGFFGYAEGTAEDKTAISDLTLQGRIVMDNGKSTVMAYSGGLVGYAKFAEISSVTVDVDITLVRTGGNWQNIGGIAGFATYGTSITDSENLGDVSGYQYVGGIAGQLSYGSSIVRSANSGSISGNSYVGGLTGNVSSTGTEALGVTHIINSYNTGSVAAESSSAYVGGITAQLQASTDEYKRSAVKNSFTTAAVSGGSTNSGLAIGRVSHADAVVENVYYLEGDKNGIGYDAGEHAATSMTAADMASAAFVTTLNTNAGENVFAKGRNHPVFARTIIGDINNDGVADSKDAQLLYSVINGETDLSAEQLTAADLNGDGAVNIADVTLLYSMVQYDGDFETVSSLTADTNFGKASCFGTGACFGSVYFRVLTDDHGYYDGAAGIANYLKGVFVKGEDGKVTVSENSSLRRSSYTDALTVINFASAFSSYQEYIIRNGLEMPEDIATQKTLAIEYFNTVDNTAEGYHTYTASGAFTYPSMGIAVVAMGSLMEQYDTARYDMLIKDAYDHVDANFWNSGMYLDPFYQLCAKYDWFDTSKLPEVTALTDSNVLTYYAYGIDLAGDYAELWDTYVYDALSDNVIDNAEAKAFAYHYAYQLTDGDVYLGVYGSSRDIVDYGVAD